MLHMKLIMGFNWKFCVVVLELIPRVTDHSSQRNLLFSPHENISNERKVKWTEYSRHKGKTEKKDYLSRKVCPDLCLRHVVLLTRNIPYVKHALKREFISVIGI